MQIKKLNNNANISRATEGSAGLDLSCLETLIIDPQTTLLVPTGIAVAIPSGFVGKVYIRSSLAVKMGITLVNSVGVIDSDYRGEIKIALYNISPHPVNILGGERIAQLVIEPILMPDLEFVDDLPETLRGEGGFGSTGQQ